MVARWDGSPMNWANSCARSVISRLTISKAAVFPQTNVAPKLAVVSIDGGRFQARSEGQGPGVHDPPGARTRSLTW